MWEVVFEDWDRELDAQKIWGGSRTLSSKAMVDDHVEGEVDPLYLHWFFDQAPLNVIPERSAREIIDRRGNWSKNQACPTRSGKKL